MVIDDEADGPDYLYFINFLNAKFKNHRRIDGKTKNALWEFWIKGGDDEVLNDDIISSDDEREEYIAISTCECDTWKRTEGIVSSVKEFIKLLKKTEKLQSEKWHAKMKFAMLMHLVAGAMNLEDATAVRKAIALLRQAIGSSLRENTGTAKP
ncbi:hypothetical protein Tco_1010922 [Tanacetum coccineum]